MTTSLLFSLAYLKVHWDSHRGIYLDNFIPFVIEALKVQKEKAISIEKLQENLFTLFHIRIPQGVIKALLNRMRKSNFVQLSNQIFYKNSEALDTRQFSKTQSEVQRIFSALILDIIAYSKQKYDVTLTEQDTEETLLSFISYNQFLIYEPYSDQEKLIEIVQTPSPEKKYIIASYIYDASKNRPEIYKYLDVVIKGYMIAQVLYLPDIYQTNKSFRKTKVFLDTSFIIFALGYSGEQYKNPCLELLDLLYQRNATLYCFEHTYEEIRGILLASSKKLSQYSDNYFGRTIRYFKSMGYKASDIELLVSQLRRNIERLRIKIVPTPDYSEQRYVMDENGLLTLLKTRMPNQRDDSAIQRDVASISAIYRLRRNNYSSNIEDSPAVFVTTNTTLAKTSSEHFYGSNDNLIAPPCLTDYVLTNLLWLKSPHSSPNLPMKRIIADSYAAIQPNDEIMSKWFNEVNRLKTMNSITEDDYYYLCSSQDAIDILMDETLGDVEALTESSVHEILERAHERFHAEAESKYLSIVEEKDSALASHERQLIDMKKREAERDNNIKNRAQRITKIVMIALKLLITIVILLGTLASLPEIGGINISLILGVSKLPLYLSLIILVVIFGYSLHNLYYGMPVSSIARDLEIKIQNTITNWLTLLSS